jgi:Fe-S cluster biogenesis protein NfuA
MDDHQARECVARIEALLDDVHDVELVQALVDLYGEGLRRIVAHDDLTALTGDEVVSHLLLLHGLHPVPLEARVLGALDEVRPYLASHGGGVELLGIADGVVHLRLEGSCDGCPSSTATLKLAIEEAIGRAAPDVERVEAVGAAPPEPGLLQIEMPAWADAGSLADLPDDAPVVRDDILLVRLGRAAYAYRPACGGCGASLADATLDGAELACGSCGRRYDVRRAGRGDDAHLAAFPLLVGEDGRMRVAVA